MPKRVVDGEAIWQSSKLSQVQPLKYRGELANLLPLMSVNGSFEADARLIWVQVYGFNRPDVKLKDVEALLKEFERVKILFRWTTEDGKVWGYFVGVEKTGRLPPPSKRYSTRRARIFQRACWLLSSEARYRHGTVPVPRG
jgi:hypothetical protein